MDEVVSKRGEEFTRILVREYEQLLEDAKTAVSRVERLIKEYEYTPTQLADQEWRASKHAEDIIHYTKILNGLKGAENGSTIPTAESEAESPKWDACTSGM